MVMDDRARARERNRERERVCRVPTSIKTRSQSLNVLDRTWTSVHMELLVG